MVPLLLHGRMGNVWYGTLLALTPLPLPTSDYHRGKQELWQFRLRKGKKQKYSCLSSTHLFTPIAIESSGVFGTEAISFVRELGLRLKNVTGEPTSRHYLIQKLSVAVQRGNAAAILGSMGGLATVEEHFFSSYPKRATRSELPEASYPKRATRSELPEASYPKRATRSELPEASYPKRATRSELPEASYPKRATRS